MNGAVEAPAAIVTVAGTEPAALFDESAMTNPPAGATPLIVTVPEDEVPPITDVGLNVTVVTAGTVIVNVAVEDVPLAVAVMSDVVLTVAPLVVIAKVPVVDPAGIEIEAGTPATELPEVNVTVVAAVVAADKVTVPVEPLPVATVDGERLTLATEGRAVIVKVAVWLAPPAVAVITALPAVREPVVATENVAVVAPASTVTDAGIVIAVPVELRATTSPPVGAALPRVTVPVVDVPLVTVLDVSDTPETAGGLIVKLAAAVLLPAVARIEAVVTALTAFVVTMKVPEFEPAGITIEVGDTVADVEVEARVTVMLLPVGTDWVRVTVAVDEAVPNTVAGLNVTVEAEIGLTDIFNVEVAAPAVPVITTVVFAATVPATAVKE